MFGTMVIKLVVGMVGVLFFLRISGKTQMAQMTPTDTVNSFVVGAIVGGIIYSPDLTIWHMLFAIFVWVVINQLVRLLSKNNFFNHLIHGQSEYLIKDGQLDLKRMKQNNLGIEQLIGKLREQGIFSLLDVDDVLFETDGQLSVYKKQECEQSYLLVSNGEILTDTLKDSGRSESWLTDELKKLGFDDLKKLYCVEWTRDRGFYIVDMDGKIQDKTKKSKVKELDKDKTV